MPLSLHLSTSSSQPACRIVRFLFSGGMAFVIIDTNGKPLCDVAGELIVLHQREEAARWTTKGERVEPYIPRRHDPGRAIA